MGQTPALPALTESLLEFSMHAAWAKHWYHSHGSFLKLQSMGYELYNMYIYIWFPENEIIITSIRHLYQSQSVAMGWPPWRISQLSRIDDLKNWWAGLVQRHHWAFIRQQHHVKHVYFAPWLIVCEANILSSMFQSVQSRISLVAQGLSAVAS